MKVRGLLVTWLVCVNREQVSGAGVIVLDNVSLFMSDMGEGTALCKGFGLSGKNGSS